MATYSSYKKVDGAQLIDGTLTDNDLATSTLNTFGVKWFYGDPGACTPGCCCLWTVPTGVCRMTLDIWGAGGNGSGVCVNQRCHHFQASGGGTYNTKSINTRGGCTYTVCAAGVYRCYSRECTACNGCTSYVNGYNLSGFCACGGDTARANTDWTTACFSQPNYCRAPGNNNGEMAIESSRPGWSTASGYCHCHPQEIHSGSAPFIGTLQFQGLRECWIKCGCWTVPYGAGGQSAMNTYCGNGCCGQGGTGGSGLVRITYL